MCLQEVGREWCGELHKYFFLKKYHFVHSGYGEPFNDYMGAERKVLFTPAACLPRPCPHAP